MKLFVFLLVLCYSCYIPDKKLNYCNKLEILFIDVLNNSKVYVFSPIDSLFKTKYLASNDYIPEGKIFFSLWNDSIISFDKEYILQNKLLKGDYLEFESIEINNDSTEVNLSIYFETTNSTSQKSIMLYKFNEDSCKWNLDKYSRVNY